MGCSLGVRGVIKAIIKRTKEEYWNAIKLTLKRNG
jgi:hypothetical protein